MRSKYSSMSSGIVTTPAALLLDVLALTPPISASEYSCYVSVLYVALPFLPDPSPLSLSLISLGSC